MDNLTQESFCEALQAAGGAHHEYQTNFLHGQHDEQWAGWYSAYLLGRLGDFATPTQLTEWLQSVSDENWFEAAAKHVLGQLRA